MPQRRGSPPPAVLVALALVLAGHAGAQGMGDAPPSLGVRTAPAPQRGATEQGKPRAQKKRPKRRATKRINIDVQDAHVVDVIRLLADVSGRNIVVGDDVVGKITLKLRNVPWDEALDVVLVTKGLARDDRGTVIRVAPKSVLDAEEDAALMRGVDCEIQSPLHTRLIPVRYGDARAMAKVVKATLSPRGRVVVDERTNTLVVHDVDCP